MEAFVFIAGVAIVIASTGGVIAFVCWYLRIRKVLRPLAEESRQEPVAASAHQTTVAIIIDEHSPSITQLLKGYRAAIATFTNQHYDIEVFVGENRTKLTRHHMKHILAGKYDCVVTTSIFITQIVQQVIESSTEKMPIIFGNIKAIEGHIVQHTEALSHTTGLLTERDIAPELSCLMALRPDVKRALLLYPSQGIRWVSHEQGQIATILRRNGVIVDELQASDDLPVGINFAAYDLMVIPAQTLSLAQLATIATACSLFQCTLYSSDPDAITAGAAVMATENKQEVGKMLAQITHDALDSAQKSPLPPVIQHIAPMKIAINQKALLAQKLHISDEMLSLVGRGLIYNSPEHVLHEEYIHHIEF